MPWLRVESKMPNHEKVHRAADALGGMSPAGRILAVWLVGAAYAVDQVTDGRVPRNVLLDRRYDRQPAQVIEALVGVGLLYEADGGYRYHDFEDYNPTGEEADAYRQKKAAAGRLGGRVSGEARRKHSASHAEAPNEAHVEAERKHTRSTASSRTEANAKPDPDPDPQDQDPDQEQRDGVAPNAHRIFVKLAHSVLDDVESGALDALSAVEELKVRIATKAQLAYTGRQVQQALESAQVQRAKARQAERRSA